MIWLRFHLPWDFASVVTVINNYEAIRTKWKCHIDVIINEVGFPRGDNVPCLQTSAMTATTYLCGNWCGPNFLCSQEQQQHVGVIWLCNENMNVITDTHSLLWLYPRGCCCALRGQLPLCAASHTGKEFSLGLWPILELETHPVQPQAAEKSGFLNLLYCVFLTLLVLTIPAPFQRLCTKAGIGFIAFGNLISWVDCNSNRVNNVPQKTKLPN